jgi:hypothetical protein
LAFTLVAKSFGAVGLSWGQITVSASFGQTPVWFFAAQAAVYLLLVAFYWIPTDPQTNETEVTGLTVFFFLLPVTLYVWAKWLRWPLSDIDWDSFPKFMMILRLAAIVVAALIAGAGLLWAAARFAAGLSDSSYARCFKAWLASSFLGLGAGAVAVAVIVWVIQSISGSPVENWVWYVIGGALGGIIQAASIREMLETTYARTVLAWVVPFAATALAAWGGDVQAMVRAIIA